jgi:hypothetical protein
MGLMGCRKTRSWHNASRLCNSRPPAKPTRERMKPLFGNGAANSPTCHVREADANLPNLLSQSSPHLTADRSNSGPIRTLFLCRARLQSCRNDCKICVGFSPCGLLFTRRDVLRIRLTAFQGKAACYQAYPSQRPRSDRFAANGPPAALKCGHSRPSGAARSPYPML